ncbi:LysR family transcriptional regulator [Hydrogenophaga sp.]|jgi:DNA-binding transcriptional LysR family regulator|uniref:LysR family transcriptional regulator n=1 Tax=Hydrogenophaga sp. TaxID=1904254 RepID=UPI003F6F9310
MDLKRANLDLNTLRVFIAVHDLRSVSAAGVELDLSQSGVSTALARLRLQLQDPLFTKTANGMEPTARARELIGPARKIIHDIESHLLAPLAFDPAKSTREFVLALSDIGEGIYLPSAIRSLYQKHSGITLRSLYMPARQLDEAMAAGEVDLAAGYFPDITSNRFHMRRIGLHSFTCIARTGHPHASGRLTAQQFAELGHVVVEPPGRSQEVFENFLKLNQMKRRIVLRTPHFMSVPIIVAETDTIAVIPQALGDFIKGHGEIQQVQLPFVPPTFEVNLYWHRSAHKDAGNRWLRGLLIDQFPAIRARGYHRNGVSETPGDREEEPPSVAGTQQIATDG